MRIDCQFNLGYIIFHYIFYRTQQGGRSQNGAKGPWRNVGGDKLLSYGQVWNFNKILLRSPNFISSGSNPMSTCYGGHTIYFVFIFLYQILKI